MKTVFTIIPDPEYKKPPVIIRQDNPGPETPVIVVPDDSEAEKDTAPPKPQEKPRPS